MSLFRVFDISGSGMLAQSTRLNTIASNLANAEVVAGSEQAAYRGRNPIFTAVLDGAIFDQQAVRVRVDGIVESTAAPRKEYYPSHPMADETGYIYRSNVDPIAEMANMMSASRSYQNNIEVMTTTKQLIMRTLSLGS